jgi:hypothetical protein
LLFVTKNKQKKRLLNSIKQLFCIDNRGHH